MTPTSSRNHHEHSSLGVQKSLQSLNKYKKEIAAAILVTLGIGYGVHKYNHKEEKNTLPKTEAFETLETILANQTIEDFAPTDGKCHEKQEQWERRYEGKDKQRDKTCSGAYNRKIVTEGFNKMIHSGDIIMIKQKIDEFNQQNPTTKIPYDVVFLALTESARNGSANSGIAGGYWQFTKSSAKSFGLDWNDRNDKEESTEAALRHFKNNIDIVNTYVRKSGKNIGESDKRKYALRMFNASPKLVKAGFGGMTESKSDDGLISHYFDNIDKYKLANPKIHADETKGYVPRILAIRSVLKDKLEKGDFSGGASVVIEKERKSDVVVTKETNADKMFERYVELSDSIGAEEQIKLLDSIKDAYIQEQKAGHITPEYLKGSLSVIEKERENLLTPEDEESGVETGVFVSEGLDKSGNYQIYSYIIKQHGTVDILKKKFHDQDGAEISSLIVTNAKGKEYPDNYAFSKNQGVFLKKNIQKSFDLVRKSSDQKHNIYSYVVKKGGNSGGVMRNFLKYTHKKTSQGILVTDRNGKEIKKNTYLYPGTKVYIKSLIK